MPLCHLVEEFDDVREVHVAVKDDVAVALDQAEGDEEKDCVDVSENVTGEKWSRY